MKNLFRAALSCSVLATLAACSLAVDTKVGAGIGVACKAATDCHGSVAQCVAGACTRSCSASDPCPSGSSCQEGLCSLSASDSGTSAEAGSGGAPGATCATNAECASNLCDDLLCTSRCTTTPECPGGFICDANMCRKTLKVGFLFDGIVSNATEGFALSHEQGRQYATQQLKWLTTDRREQVQLADSSAKMEELIRDGSEVLVVTTSRFAPQAAEKATTNPTLRVLQYSSGTPTPNYTVYSARYHQAWYLAGIVAARHARGLTDARFQNSIGIVAPVSNAQVNRQLSAFARGALSVNPQAMVEVVWANSFVPSAAVVRGLVDYLLAGNSRVIVNRLGNGEVVRWVDTKTTATPRPVSVGIDNQTACSIAPTSCIGAPYWNWGVLYTRLFDNIHRNRPDGANVVNDRIQFDPAKSTFHFALNKAGFPALGGLESEIVTAIGSLNGADGKDLTLSGPFCPSTASQRPAGCLTAGESVSDEEYNTMCWLAAGLFQRQDTENPTSALVPAKAPAGDVFWPPKSIDATNVAQPTCTP